ncbi:hypothetical protein D3C81_2098050 [compost metagenome]
MGEALGVGADFAGVESLADRFDKLGAFHTQISCSRTVQHLAGCNTLVLHSRDKPGEHGLGDE